jgi:DNA mismatch endonuclease (patch repair protein)
MDILSQSERSERMRMVRSKGSKVELRVRRLIHSLGFRYRLHVRSLPGQPDIVFPAKHKVILVHGCFWHRHAGCRLARLPKSKQEYWVPKLEANRTRDEENVRQLQALGWAVMVIWECQASVQHCADLADPIGHFLR